jgi:hypothetical protein
VVHAAHATLRGFWQPIEEFGQKIAIRWFCAIGLTVNEAVSTPAARSRKSLIAKDFPVHHRATVAKRLPCREKSLVESMRIDQEPDERQHS